MPSSPAVLDPETFNLLGRAYKARSFPSGHSLTAFLLASVCFCYTKNVFFKVVLITLAVLVGLSRVLIGVHWPMDGIGWRFIRDRSGCGWRHDHREMEVWLVCLCPSIHAESYGDCLHCCLCCGQRLHTCVAIALRRCWSGFGSGGERLYFG